MKYNLVNLMRCAADALDAVNDQAGRAYAIREASNNMMLLLNGSDTLDDFKTCYTAGTSKEIDPDTGKPS